MTAHEDVYKGAKFGGLKTKEDVATALAAIIPNKQRLANTVFLCIGTDRSTGDALGPLVGTYLRGLGYTNVLGTVDEPVHAVNLAEMLAAIPKRKKVIAIDATLGTATSVGSMSVYRGSIKPGAGVGKDLPSAGDYSITGCVNVGGFMEYFVLQNTRLPVTMHLARDITSAIVEVMPLDRDEQLPKRQRRKKTISPLKEAVTV